MPHLCSRGYSFLGEGEHEGLVCCALCLVLSCPVLSIGPCCDCRYCGITEKGRSGMTGATCTSASMSFMRRPLAQALSRCHDILRPPPPRTMLDCDGVCCLCDEVMGYVSSRLCRGSLNPLPCRAMSWAALHCVVFAVLSDAVTWVSTWPCSALQSAASPPCCTLGKGVNVHFAQYLLRP